MSVAIVIGPEVVRDSGWRGRGGGPKMIQRVSPSFAGRIGPADSWPLIVPPTEHNAANCSFKRAICRASFLVPLA